LLKRIVVYAVRRVSKRRHGVQKHGERRQGDTGRRATVRERR
jgi:hypothetical protein